MASEGTQDLREWAPRLNLLVFRLCFNLLKAKSLGLFFFIATL
ncbi:hypothetical protein CAL7102_02322 [Dulcicalothrix desertica PCC 7102]|nr:hypothetical protein CAL7102_02322 [Dulcicalothrix desertica PCC 7102]